jgi:hypothetical protein
MIAQPSQPTLIRPFRSARPSLCAPLLFVCQASSPEVRGRAVEGEEWRCGLRPLCALPTRSARSADVPPSAVGAPCRCRSAAAAAASFFLQCPALFACPPLLATLRPSRTTLSQLSTSCSRRVRAHGQGAAAGRGGSSSGAQARVALMLPVVAAQLTRFLSSFRVLLPSRHLFVVWPRSSAARQHFPHQLRLRCDRAAGRRCWHRTL